MLSATMGTVDRKLGLLGDIARLRRAQRGLPGDRDIAAVRSRLERELGETVSRRTAARFLGVSHTALNRWVRAGDLPLVYATSGREEVPVAALLDLRERTDEQRQRARHHVLEPVMAEGRDRARRMRLDPATRKRRSDAPGHSRADRRSLAYHRAVAKVLNRRMAGEGLHRVWKWRDEGKIDPLYADDWERLLARPLAEIKRAISEDSERGRELRQTSPLAGMLSEPERRRILEVVR